MRNLYAFRYRAFLNPVSTNQTSYIFAHVESSYGGAERWGDNLIFIADCRQVVKLEFPIGNGQTRRHSLHKLDLLINTLSAFRAALVKEMEQIDNC